MQQCYAYYILIFQHHETVFHCQQCVHKNNYDICRGIKVSESWPFSCPGPTVLLSRSFSFQSAFSSFSIVGITVNRTQQVLSRTTLRWHEKIYSVKSNIFDTQLLSKPLLCLSNGIDRRRHLRCWKGRGCLCIREKFLSVWVDQYLDSE